MKKLWMLATVFLLLIILFGCVDVPEEMLPTQTKKPTATITQSATTLPATKTPSQTSTPITFDDSICDGSYDDKVKWVEEAFQLNEDCLFPCVANHALIVGETTNDEAKHNLSCIYGSYSSYSLQNGDMELSYYLENSRLEVYGGISFVRRNDVVFLSHIGMKGNLSDFLKLYGPPDEIWAFAEGITVFGPYGGFDLKLFYKEEGVVVSFFDDETESGVYIDVCKSQLDDGVLSILLVDPEFSQDNDFLTIMSEVHPYYLFYNDSIDPIEELSNINVDWFYETYIQEDTTECFSILSQSCYRDPEFCSLPPTLTPISPDS